MASLFSNNIFRGGLAVSLIALVVVAANFFVDDNNSVHENSINAIAAQGITRGCNPPVDDKFCPTDPVTRGEMAAFLDRALNLQPATRDYFSDDDGSVFEGDVDALAAAGITLGCNPPANDRYCPDRPVNRGEMAVFLQRAFKLPLSSSDYFADDDGSIYESAINALAKAGVTQSCDPPYNDRFCPVNDVSREQMASFIARALDLVPSTPLSPPNAPSNDGLLWRAGLEGGDVSEWSFVAISGDASAQVSSQQAHTGSKSLELQIRNADGSGVSPGVRMEKHNGIPGYGGATNLPDEAYYSVYYYFPETVSQSGWFWNVFQWKKAYITDSGQQSRYPVWVVNVDGDRSGHMRFLLSKAVDDNNHYDPEGVEVRQSAIDVPAGRWVHLECFYRWSLEPKGRITCWQDGVKIWDVIGVRTDMSYDYEQDPRQWSVDNYAADLNPSTVSIWVDDAAISLTRLGPDWTETAG